MTSTCIYGVKSNTPSIDGKFHYVYRITNLVENKHYYGKRSSKINPHSDIGIKYFSSSGDKTFINDQKENPDHYKYKVLLCFENRKEALNFEVFIHKYFDVRNHSKFYNAANQTSNGFDYDPTGTTLSEETKSKISKTLTGHKHSIETRKKISNGNINPSWETRKKMSERRKGTTLSEETKSKISKTLTGFKRSEESRANYSAAKQNVTAITREKLSSSRKNMVNCFDLIQQTHVTVSKEEFKLNKNLIGNRSRILNQYLNCHDNNEKEELLLFLIKKRSVV